MSLSRRLRRIAWADPQRSPIAGPDDARFTDERSLSYRYPGAEHECETRCRDV